MIFTSLLFRDLKADVLSLCKVRERSWFARSLSDLRRKKIIHLCR